MTGAYEVIVKNRRLQYKFTIYRNITILKGDSATGKTTLIDMIQSYQENAEASGVSVISKCNCVVLTANNWELNLSVINLYERNTNSILKPELVIVEDSKSGYQFFKNVCNQFSIPCISAEGKSKIFNEIIKNPADDILIIADGAAFGAEIENIVSLMKIKNLGIYLPESFEWLILKSGLIKENNIDKILENPSDYIDSQKYFSWELFFTDLLKKSTNGTYLEYSKAKLNPAYLQEKESKMIMKEMPVFREEV